MSYFIIFISIDGQKNSVCFIIILLRKNIIIFRNIRCSIYCYFISDIKKSFSINDHFCIISINFSIKYIRWIIIRKIRTFRNDTYKFNWFIGNRNYIVINITTINSVPYHRQGYNRQTQRNIIASFEF